MGVGGNNMLGYLFTAAFKNLLRVFADTFFLLVLPRLGTGKTYLTIKSQPSGASVEIDGISVGTTPYQIENPGSYVHGGKTVFTKFLRNQMHLRLTLDG